MEEKVLIKCNLLYTTQLTALSERTMLGPLPRFAERSSAIENGGCARVMVSWNWAQGSVKVLASLGLWLRPLSFPCSVTFMELRA